ncbi:MAG: tripartite tricarboxylate transporter permease [Salinarimonas sp.]|nr:tripartite tricarboxylate transporter permease [Salinarimonas sp.]
MDLFSNLMLGVDTALDPTTLLYCLIGVTLGTLIGVLPGIGALATISLLLPITYHIAPAPALVMLAGVWYGAQYGGSIASILLNLPGTPSSAVVCLDGYPMTKQGRAGVALFVTTIASFVGSMIGIFILVMFTPAIAALALRFGPAEYFAIMLLGLVAASTVAAGPPVKGLAMVVLGLLLGTVGTDVGSGVARFHFGFPQLRDGITLVALAMGLFGIAEVVGSVNRKLGAEVRERITFRSMLPTRTDVRQSSMPMLRGSAVGSFIGALPGAGVAISAFMAYAVEKRIARDPSRFGKGAIEGITGPEAANNAAAQTAFVPTLALGIPGSATMGLMLGALIIHGIQPGPLFISNQPELFWGLVVSFGVGNILLVILNLPLIGMWVALLRVPYKLLYPAIIIFICIGVYSVRNNVFDIQLVAVIGILGYILVTFGFSAAPLLLGFVLGPLMEETLRRTLLLSRGDPTVFIERPISAGFLAVTAALLIWSAYSSYRMQRREKLARESGLKAPE